MHLIPTQKWTQRGIAAHPLSVLSVALLVKSPLTHLSPFIAFFRVFRVFRGQVPLTLILTSHKNYKCAHRILPDDPLSDKVDRNI